MTDRRSITLPLCVLGAGAVHGLCVAAMLPMLITLPGPGGNVPQAIDVEVLQPTPRIAPKQAADPATTSALPKVSDAPAAPSGEPATPAEAVSPANDVVLHRAPEDASTTAKVEPSPVEVPPDDMPQQIASPAASAPTGIDALTPEPLAPTLVMAPALEPSAPEEVKQVMLAPDDDITSSIIPVEADLSTQRLDEAAEQSTPPPVSEKPRPAPEPRPEVARADPKGETPPQASPAEVETEEEISPAPAPVAEPAARKKLAPQAATRTRSPARAETKSSQTKSEPIAAKKRPVATVRRTATQSRRVVRGRAQTPVNQGIMSLFTLKPPVGSAANARRPLVRQ